MKAEQPVMGHETINQQHQRQLNC